MLIKCPECEHNVSDQADKCPNCGFPLKKGLNKKTNISPSTCNQQDTHTEKNKRKQKTKFFALIIAILMIIAAIIILVSNRKTSVDYKSLLPFILSRSNNTTEAENYLKNNGCQNVNVQSITEKRVEGDNKYNILTSDNCTLFGKTPENFILSLKKVPVLTYYFPEDRETGNYKGGPVFNELLNKLISEYGEPNSHHSRLAIWQTNELYIQLSYEPVYYIQERPLKLTVAFSPL